MAACVAIGVVASAGAWAYREMRSVRLDRADALSVVVLDREDRLLRAYQGADGRWRLPVETKDVDPRYLAMLLAYEDKRFNAHRGVDPYAIGRAVWLAARHGRILSGGSTLTMQVARLLTGQHERTSAGKIRQALRALALEGKLTKTEILRIYLRLAPFGGNLEGVRAASLAYFGKEPRRLSPGEAALLVALPQSPKLRRPDRFPEAARRARDRVLARAQAAGVISAEEMRRAMSERVPTERKDFPKLAPHLADAELEENKGQLIHRLTIDAQVQTNLEQLVREHVAGLSGRLSAAVVAVDHKTGEVIASVGSPGYLDDTRFGAVDMTKAVRSPGSTLKPFIYGLAFEAGLAHPDTLIEDRPTRFGLYAPKNFDQDWHGTVTIRLALAQSLNIPAVKVLDVVGVAKLHARLQQAGAVPVYPKGAEPSLAMALGGMGLRLTDLAALYTALGRGGEVVPLRVRREIAAKPKSDAQAQKPAAAPPLLSPVAAWYVSDILRNAPAPANAKPGEIAYKTGTSYGFRDAWAAGYDGRHAIAVWVGRPDGAATPGLAGRTAAAPILFDAFARIARTRAPLPGPPSGVITVASQELPPPLKRFREAGENGGRDWSSDEAYLEPAVQIAFPPDRSELEMEDGEKSITVKAEGGALPLTWLVDGVPVATAANTREATLPAATGGFYRLSVIDAKGRADRVTVRVK